MFEFDILDNSNLMQKNERKILIDFLKILKEQENSKTNHMNMDNITDNITTISGELAEEEFEKMYAAPVGIIVLLSIFYGVISIIAIFGNSLVIWVVVTTRQMHTVTNLYIANLAFADVIIGMFCVPFQFQAAISQKWSLPDFMCAFCPFVQAVSVNVSVFTLTAIAVDRHRAIINPLRARPKRFISKLIISGIWISAISFSIPFGIAFRVIKIEEKFREGDIFYNVTKSFCENVNLSYEQLQSTRYYLVFVQYVIPFCVISFVYIQMAIKLWGSRTPGNAQDARDITLLRNKKKVIKMLIIVVVVFGMCWLPLQTYNILYVTWPDINDYRFINIIWFCCDWLAMSNSCYNPFIYGIYNEKFKREFNKRFSLCFYKFTTNSFDGLDPTRTSCHTRASSIRSTYGNTSTRIRNNCMILPQQYLNNGTKKRNGAGLNNNLSVSYKINGSNDNKKLNSVVYYGKPSIVNTAVLNGTNDTYDNNDSVVSITLSNLNENYGTNSANNTVNCGSNMTGTSHSINSNDVLSSESDSFLTSSNNDSCYNVKLNNNNMKKLRQTNDDDEKSLKDQFSAIFKSKKDKKVTLNDSISNSNIKLIISSSSSSGTARQLNFGSNSSNFEIGDGLRIHKGRITDTNRMTMENLTNNYESNEMSVIGYPLLNSTIKGDNIQIKHTDSYLY